LESLAVLLGRPDLGKAAREIVRSLAHRPDIALRDARLLCPVVAPAKVLCIGLNYRDHMLETKVAEQPYPAVFPRFADTLVPHGAPLLRPHNSAALDFEGELAVVIGKGGRHISESSAMEHVGGYACFNDASLRDWQFHTSQVTPGKNFPGTGAFGPYVVTCDEAPPVASMQLLTRLNGQVMQSASVGDLVYPIPQLIAYCSAFTRLSPGDVIATGTPSGVGNRRTPKVFMRPGDSIEVEITGVGTLVNSIVDEPPAAGT
jgi:2-keto-4-pentenoate hydratase/2-oxohepta-3-ene-1,7-dioic acid hydratase in catechol pathway